MKETDDLYLIYQPIVKLSQDDDVQILSHEVLLRSREQAGFPEQRFMSLIASDEGNARLLKLTHDALLGRLAQTEGTLICLNLHHQQLLHPSSWRFLEEMRPHNDRLVVEISELAPLQPILETADPGALRNLLKRITDLGFRVAMDDISTGQNSLALILENIEWIACLKFTLLPFRDVEFELVNLFLLAWLKLAERYGVHFVVEGVDTLEMSQLLKEQNLVIQQGYIWGKGEESCPVPESH